MNISWIIPISVFLQQFLEYKMNGNRVLNLRLKEPQLLPGSDYIVSMTFTVLTGFLTAGDSMCSRSIQTFQESNCKWNNTFVILEQAAD